MTLSTETRDKLKHVSISAICNALLVRGLSNVWIRHVAPVVWHDMGNMVGEAYTLRFMPSREDLDTLSNYAKEDHIHRRAVEECPEGHVLVIDSMGKSEAASAGDLMVTRLLVRGAAGIVTDGGYRDMADIAKIRFPAYQCKAAPPASPSKMHPVDLNVPIGCGGVAVYPGDVIVGDATGVVVIPAHLATEVAGAVTATMEYEIFAAEQIATGRSIFEVFPATSQSRIEYEAWLKLREAG